jgi:hypothetical protein
MIVDAGNVLQVENFCPKYIQKELLLLSNTVKYLFLPSITYPFEQKQRLDWVQKWNSNRNIQDTCGFSSVLDESEYKKVTEIVKLFTKKNFDIEIQKFTRVMFVIIPPNPLYKDDHELTPHIDVVNASSSLKNLLYYVNDNDAPTVFYNQKVSNMNDIDFTNIEISERVYPKMGKASLWDGSIIHSANVSKTNLRITLNVLFE